MNKLKSAELNNRILKSYRPLDRKTLESLRNYYRIELTYSSNAIEGNSLTESETKIVIEDGLTIEGKPLRDVYEATGHAKAYDYLYKILDKKKLLEEDILTFHRLFYQQIDADKAGRYRAVPVFISGSSYAVTPPQKIASEVKSFFKWYNANESKMHPVKLAALAHQKFVFIHPFIDGNGRVARLLMNLSLLRNDYTIAIIPSLLRQQYISLLEKAHTDNIKFIDFIADSVINTQNDLIRLLKESGGVKQSNGVINNDNETHIGGVKNRKTEMLELIKKYPGINTPAISKQLNLSLRTAQRVLKQLVEQGAVHFKGAPKTGGYFLTSQD
ncbi:MAG: hypothetical protein A2X47_00130 [Lentisphaerae bacterium GWF2_38_69]|nr:MAG: hypothetical protein A2X47_00130 [Lentisphaerae bacterium GWF2_38_69]